MNDTDFDLLASKIIGLSSKGNLADVSAELRQLYQKGYYDGVDNGWWKEREQKTITVCYDCENGGENG